jgi:acetyl-CoA synthetase
MNLEYKSFEDAKNNFKWSDRWKVFDKSKEHLNIAFECVDRHPKENIAIRLKNQDGINEEYTFGELSALTSKFANMLEKNGVNKGDCVGIVLSPSLEYYISLLGTLKRGAVAVPCYHLLGSDGIEYRLKTANAKLAIIVEDRKKYVKEGLVQDLITSESLLEKIKNESDSYETDTAFDDLALLQFSSGTTGQPTPVKYPHGAMSVTAVFVKLWLGLKSTDSYICTSSPAWGHGIWYGTIGPLIYGNAIGVYNARFDAEDFIKTLEQFEVTVISAIPRVYKMMMECGKLDDYKLKIRRLTYTGGAMEPEVSQFYSEKYGIYIASNYGNTEAGPLVIDYAVDDWRPRPGSAGKPMIGVELNILDENGNKMPTGEIGEVAVRRSGQWVYIGDSGCLDEDGYFYPKGRSDDVIKSSGFRIGPFEVENVIEKHQTVQRAAVVGSPHEERGEIVKAFVVLKPDVQPSEELIKEIQNFVKARLSMHEYPKEIEFVKELPETPDGKLKRKILKMQEYEKKNVKKPA